MTISIFGEARGAAGSRDLARRWTEENLQDLEFTRVWALDGEILVSRAKEDMLEPWHVGTSRKFASVRHYALRGGSVAALMHKVDEIFADRIERLDGFDAYNAPPIGRFGSENRAVLRARSREGSPNSAVVTPSARPAEQDDAGVGVRRPRLSHAVSPECDANALRSTTPAPQSKPVTPAPRLVAQNAPSVTSGRGLRIVAAGPVAY